MSDAVVIPTDLLGDLEDEIAISLKGCLIVLAENPNNTVIRARKLRCEQYLAEIQAILRREETEDVEAVETAAAQPPKIMTFQEVAEMYDKQQERLFGPPFPQQSQPKPPTKSPARPPERISSLRAKFGKFKLEP